MDMKIALRMIFHDKLRFFITIIGVGFSVNLIIVQLGMTFGMLNNTTVTIENMDADLWITSNNPKSLEYINTFPDSYVYRVRSTPGVLRADNLLVFFSSLKKKNGDLQEIVIYGLEDFARWRFPWDILYGNSSDLRRGPYVLLDKSAEAHLGVFNFGDSYEISNTRMKIIGKTRGAMSFSTSPISFMNFFRAQSIAGSLFSGKTSYVLVKLMPDTNVETVRDEIRARLPHNEVLTKLEWAEKCRSHWVYSTGIGVGMAVTCFMGCLVGFVIVGQALYTATMENLSEFGTLKAIGGSNLDIYRLLGTQALVTAIVGFLLGSSIALVAKSFIEDAGLDFVVDLRFGLSVFLGTLFMCTFASMLSFRRVSSIDPAVVFRL